MFARVGALVLRLLEVSERAADIARMCRAEKVLFDLLVQKKTGQERNERFQEDFKTLADVLIQETVRYYLGKEFAVLQGHILGEENNMFTNALGETIEVKVMESEVATVSLLERILDRNAIAARLLAGMVHRPMSVSLPSEFDTISEDQLDLSQLGVWIDPIDGTNQYVDGLDGEANARGLYTHGLRCVTVLIGVFNRSTGQPLLGVVNQPFWQKASGEGNRWNGRVACGISIAGKTAVHIPVSSNHVASRGAGDSGGKVCVLSSSESAEIKETLVRAGWQITTPSGAGYKLLSVMDGLADVFLLSKRSTFKWDTCGPHAILKACGGNVLSLAPLLAGGKPNELVYHHPECEEEGPRWCNRGGIVAFRSKEVYLKLLSDINH